MQNLIQYIQEHKHTITNIVGAVLIIVILVLIYTFIGNPFASKEPVVTSNTSHTPPQLIDLSQNQTASGTVKYLLPKSKVTPVYSSIYNNMANEALSVMHAYQNDMGPLLIQTQTATKAKDYAKLQSIGNRVGVINDAQKIRLATLSGDLDNLAIANKNLSDQKTIQLTNDLVTTGKDMVAKYTAMAHLIDSMLSGKVSASTPSEMKTVSEGLEPSARAFFTSAQKLGIYFTDTLKGDVKEYLATHPETATSTKK
jgi:hypothetical protein